MIGGGLRYDNCGYIPSTEVTTKKGSFGALNATWQKGKIALLLRAKDKGTETRRTPKSFKPALKTVQSLLARERRELLFSGTPSKR